MKNGDQRSKPWLARALKEYTRDDEGVQTALMLVTVLPTPSVDTIRTWSIEQCLLAEDWAWNVHASASDNNNRVPACPDFLLPYQPRYPGPTAEEVARKAIEEMAADNGTCYHPTQLQLERLVAGIRRMLANGCHFTAAEISLFGAGEHGECLAHFQRLAGFEIAHKAMVDIFDERNDRGRQKTDDERVADRKRWHRGEEAAA